MGNLVVRILLLFVFFAGATFAQSNFAVVSGSVIDPQGLPVTGATISFRATATGDVRQFTTNEHGLFEATALLPGDCEITSVAPGFSSRRQSLRLEVGQRISIEIPLTVGSVQQTTQVQSVAEVLRTTDATVGEVIEPKSVRELPLNGRMLIDLVLTVPGAHVGFGAQTGREIQLGARLSF